MIEDFRTPGQYIRALLEERGWDQRVLAVVLAVEESALSKLISGSKALDAEMALALAEVFAVEPERFLELQQKYDLAKALIVSRPDKGRADRAVLFGQLPISEMIHRGWIDAKAIRDVVAVEAALTKFFGVSSAAEIEILPHAAKKTNTAAPVTPTQLAWIYRVKQIASEMLVPAYSRPALLRAIEKLKTLLLSAEEARKVPRILAEAGVRFTIVESLKSAKIDGICFWLNDASPVIGMSLRFDRIDNFWFVLRHELEHVLQQHGRDAIVLDADLEGERAGTGSTISEEERLANEAAADFCVSRNSIEQFIARKAPVFAERDILGFAKTLQIHPGLVAGQLQRRTERYDLFRKHLVKIRSIVSPSAMVDGWGDVAPTST